MSVSEEILSILRLNRQVLLLVLTTSAIPIWLLDRFRWNNRIGIDQIHLILFQTLSLLILNHHQNLNKFKSTTGLTTSKSNLQGISNTEKTSNGSQRSKSSSSNIGTDNKEKDDQDLIGSRDREEEGFVEEFESLIKDLRRNGSEVFPTNGLEILQHPSLSSIYFVKVEIDEDEVNLEQLVRCLTERKRWEWDRMFECGEDLGDGVSWVRLKGFWPIKPKELVMRSKIVQLNPSKLSSSSEAEDQRSIQILAFSQSTNHPRKTSNMEIKFAGYLIERTSDGTLSLTQIVDLTGFGNLPNFLIKAILTKFIPSSIGKLKSLAKGIEKTQDRWNSSNRKRPDWLPNISTSASRSSSVRKTLKEVEIESRGKDESNSLREGGGESSDEEEEEKDDLKPTIYQLKKVLKGLREHEEVLKGQRRTMILRDDGGSRRGLFYSLRMRRMVKVLLMVLIFLIGFRKFDERSYEAFKRKVFKFLFFDKKFGGKTTGGSLGLDKDGRKTTLIKYLFV